MRTRLISITKKISLSHVKNYSGANLPQKVGIMASIPKAPLTSVPLTKNLEILTKDGNKKATKLKIEDEQTYKPLVILLSWLLAKQKHINKFADFYNHLGFDVLKVSIKPWQMLWPAKGTQVIAADILKILERNQNYSPLIIHGFSVGGYVWGEVLVKMAQDQQRYQPIIDRIVGQIWDSAADITEIPVGLPFAVFPNNPFMQAALKRYTIYHLKTFKDFATRHYENSSRMFHNNLVKAPALCLLSKTDPVGTEESYNKAKNAWEELGIKVYWKCWDKSPHVGHYYHHPEEYMNELNSFLNDLGLGPQQLQSKL